MKKAIKALLSMITLMVMVFAMSVMVSAATPSKVTGLKQTDATDYSISVEWDSQFSGCAYVIEISENGKDGWKEYGPTSMPKGTINNLSPGKTYYVKAWAYDTASYEDGPDSDIITVVTAPSKTSNVHQTVATTSSITIEWNAVAGATSYQIYERINGVDKLVAETKTNSYKITGLKNTQDLPFTNVYVHSVRSASYKAVQDIGPGISASSLKLVPAKVSNVQITNYYSSSKKAVFSCNQLKYAAGAEYEVYEKNGKKVVSKGTTAYSNGNYVANIKVNKFYKIRVRAYVSVNGKNVYGAWSDYKYFAQQPKVSLKRSGSGVKCSWKKVKGATNYTVYMSTKSSSGYKKVATTKKTSLKITKFKKKKISKNKTYYVKVVANTKVGKKTYQSNKNEKYYYFVLYR